MLGLDGNDVHKIEVGSAIWATGNLLARGAIRMAPTILRETLFGIATVAGNEVVKQYIDERFRKKSKATHRSRDSA